MFFYAGLLLLTSFVTVIPWSVPAKNSRKFLAPRCAPRWLACFGYEIFNHKPYELVGRGYILEVRLLFENIACWQPT
jgi:hypothetical protein